MGKNIGWVSAGLSNSAMWHFSKNARGQSVKTICGLELSPVIIVKTGHKNPPPGLHCVICNSPLPTFADVRGILSKKAKP